MADLDAPEILDGLGLQPWQPLKCDKIEIEEEEDFLDLLDMEEENNSNDNDKLFQIKCHFMDQCIGVLLTDLINVWYCEQSQSYIKSTQKKLNPAMESNTIEQINKQIQNMLCFSDQIGSNHFKTITFNNEKKTSLIMDISMKIENIIPFKWQLKFIQYGSLYDQATLLKQQLILPLMSIANQLSSKLNPTNNKNDYNNNKNTIFQQNITDTFLQFNIRSTMADLYKNTMDFLTFSHMGCDTVINDDNQIIQINQPIPKPKVRKIIPKNNNNNIMDNGSLPQMPKGRKKKRTLIDSMDNIEPLNKRQKINNNNNNNNNNNVYNDSDDDVLDGLIGRENDLQMGGISGNSMNDDDTMDFMSTNSMNDSVMATETQQAREELKRREELRQKLEAKKKDVKIQKKKKKKK
eukprot:226951_1